MMNFVLKMMNFDTNDKGVTRVRFESGWISEKAGDGTVLLELVEEEEEGEQDHELEQEEEEGEQDHEPEKPPKKLSKKAKAAAVKAEKEAAKATKKLAKQEAKEAAAAEAARLKAEEEAGFAAKRKAQEKAERERLEAEAAAEAVRIAAEEEARRVAEEQARERARLAAEAEAKRRAGLCGARATVAGLVAVTGAARPELLQLDELDFKRLIQVQKEALLDVSDGDRRKILFDLARCKQMEVRAEEVRHGALDAEAARQRRVARQQADGLDFDLKNLTGEGIELPVGRRRPSGAGSGSARKEEAVRVMDGAFLTRFFTFFMRFSCVFQPFFTRFPAVFVLKLMDLTAAHAKAMAATEVDNPHRDQYTSRWGTQVGSEEETREWLLEKHFKEKEMLLASLDANDDEEGATATVEAALRVALMKMCRNRRLLTAGTF